MLCGFSRIIRSVLFLRKDNIDQFGKNRSCLNRCLDISSRSMPQKCPVFYTDVAAGTHWLLCTSAREHCPLSYSAIYDGDQSVRTDLKRKQQDGYSCKRYVKPSGQCRPCWRPGVSGCGDERLVINCKKGRVICRAGCFLQTRTGIRFWRSKASECGDTKTHGSGAGYVCSR